MGIYNSLQDIRLGNLGRFLDDIGSFQIRDALIARRWPYFYVNEYIFLRCDQHGIDTLQVTPPDGNAILKRSKDSCSPFLIWVRPEGYEQIAFTNFYSPVLRPRSCSTSPQLFSCTYTPWAVEYDVLEFDLFCKTRIQIFENMPAIQIEFSIKNNSSDVRKVKLYPSFLPHCWTNNAASWDVPHLYQQVHNIDDPGVFCTIRTGSPKGINTERFNCFFLMDHILPTRTYIFKTSFAGHGTFASPECVWYGSSDQNTASMNIGQENVIAAETEVALNPNESHNFEIITGYIPDARMADFPSDAEKFRKNLTLTKSQNQSIRVKHFQDLCSNYRVSTPDESLDKYVNEFVKIQLEWISYLDRGWASGLRGTRDAAQDFTGLIGFAPQRAKQTIFEIISLQRNNGSFLRQYNPNRPKGPHDERLYVDSGLWVWELIYEYLCLTRDFGILTRKLPFVNAQNHTTLFDHIIRLFDFFVAPQNIGEHGLCKIYEGDWNDSVNRAGLEGRGESVMVSCHLVNSLGNLIKLLGFLKTHDPKNSAFANIKPDAFQKMKERVSAAILGYALNKNGFFNGVFTDNGDWIFSDSDPDGQSRISCPVNSFGLIAGILSKEQVAKVLTHLKSLRRKYGYLLFSPPIGDIPIAKLGRLGSGDLAGGLAENATVYNHGSNGFLGRAAAVAGDGELLYDTLNCMYPYNQEIHPVGISKTPPYAIVNHWRTVVGAEGQGGDCFFTGSLSVGLRNVFSGMIGFRPELDGIVIDPVLPASWNKASAVISVNFISFEIEIINSSGKGNTVKEMLLNNLPVNSRRKEVYRSVGFISDELLLKSNTNLIRVFV